MCQGATVILRAGPRSGVYLDFASSPNSTSRRILTAIVCPADFQPTLPEAATARDPPRLPVHAGESPKRATGKISNGLLNLIVTSADLTLLEDCNFQTQRAATKQYSAWWRCRFEIIQRTQHLRVTGDCLGSYIHRPRLTLRIFPAGSNSRCWPCLTSAPTSCSPPHISRSSTPKPSASRAGAEGEEMTPFRVASGPLP